MIIGDLAEYEINTVTNDFEEIKDGVDLTKLLLVVPFLPDYSESLFSVKSVSPGVTTFGFCDAARVDDADISGCYLETMVFNGTGSFVLNVVGRNDDVDDGEYLFELTVMPSTLCNVTYCTASIDGTPLELSSITLSSVNLDDDTAGLKFEQENEAGFEQVVIKASDFDLAELVDDLWGPMESFMGTSSVDAAAVPQLWGETIAVGLRC